MKKLVVYFSRVGENSVNGNIEIIKKGFTEILAEKIASLSGAAMFKIEPVEPYPTDYNECVKRSRMEDETNNDENRRGSAHRLCGAGMCLDNVFGPGCAEGRLGEGREERGRRAVRDDRHVRVLHVLDDSARLGRSQVERPEEVHRGWNFPFQGPGRARRAPERAY